VIYRIEFRKDGSVASCAEIESHLKEGGLVCYVEAENREDALTRAQSKWKEWRAKRLVRLENGGSCSMCGKRARKDGSVKCEHCLGLQRDNKKDLRNILSDPDAGLLIELRRQAIAEERRASLGKATGAALAVRVKRAEARWDLGLLEPYERSALRRILTIYDQDPVNFRARVLRLLGQEAQAAE
jgi:hypothetical protein